MTAAGAASPGGAVGPGQRGCSGTRPVAAGLRAFPGCCALPLRRERGREEGRREGRRRREAGREGGWGCRREAGEGGRGRGRQAGAAAAGRGAARAGGRGPAAAAAPLRPAALPARPPAALPGSARLPSAPEHCPGQRRHRLTGGSTGSEARGGRRTALAYWNQNRSCQDRFCCLAKNSSFRVRLFFFFLFAFFSPPPFFFFFLVVERPEQCPPRSAGLRAAGRPGRMYQGHMQVSGRARTAPGGLRETRLREVSVGWAEGRCHPGTVQQVTWGGVTVALRLRAGGSGVPGAGAARRGWMAKGFCQLCN